MSSFFESAARTTVRGWDSKKGPQRKYGLPLFIGEDELDTECRAEIEEATKFEICEAAWTTLHNLGRKAFSTVKDRAKGTKSYVNGNTGKRHVYEEKEMAYEQIHNHLTKLVESYIEPHAFRQVKDTAGMTSFQEDDKDYLPPRLANANAT